jgi:hypothetical protein
VIWHGWHDQLDPGTRWSEWFKPLVHRSRSSVHPCGYRSTWAAVVLTQALWAQFRGPVVNWNVDLTRIQRTSRPCLRQNQSQLLLLTAVKSAPSRVLPLWRTLNHGKPAMLPSANKDIGPPRALCMQSLLNLHAFNDSFVEHSIGVLVHLKLGHAVVPVRCVLVDHALGDVVPFWPRYDTALPAAFVPRQGQPLGQGLGIIHVCLGVPEGSGVSFPSRKMAECFSPQRPGKSCLSKSRPSSQCGKSGASQARSSPL